MTEHAVLERYVSFCHDNLRRDDRAAACLARLGIKESFVAETFQLGYATGSLAELVDGNDALKEQLERLKLLKDDCEVFRGRLVIPLFDEQKVLANVLGCSLGVRPKRPVVSLKSGGLFNAPFLSRCEEMVLAPGPRECLLLVQNDVSNATFLSGSEAELVRFVLDHSIRKVVFTFEGGQRLFHELTKNGVSTVRRAVDFRLVATETDPKAYLERAFSGDAGDSGASDTIQEIESGFLFRFPHLSYRVIGNFTEYNVSLRANIKAFTETDAFVDQVDLYKSRGRQTFVFTVMDRFGIRDQLQLETDLNQIIEVIEKHREKKALEKKSTTVELTDHQKDVGTRFLENPKLLDEIEADFTSLGYVRERKNKLLLYLVMTSRLTENPLHVLLVSRSGAGKSRLVEITEQLCPPEHLESVSDLSAQALYYYGQNDLAHKFVVIGEKEGSEGSDYPLRELISKRSITKAIPMKDPVTGQIKTERITVNGPIALAETTTSGEVNPENLNRCFVVGIDESEDQTRVIHEQQRRGYTIDGFIQNRDLGKIIEKHVYAQRLLRPVLVFNPFAEALTFPTSKLRTRRDNDKFLRLINVICFLHQYQRKVKERKLPDGQIIEYIECTPEDYRVAYELLADGVLDNTLDDLPRPARKLLDHIKRYLQERAGRDGVPVNRLLFERKDIREYTSWSFAQVRNGFRTLRDYEYIQLIRSQNGVASQYRLNGSYSELDFLSRILKPEELTERLAGTSVTRTT